MTPACRMRYTYPHRGLCPTATHISGSKEVRTVFIDKSNLRTLQYVSNSSSSLAGPLQS